ncbi:MAG TPA: nuclear transport factor 2 family protein [Candidatus Acidoferrum sp.]|nr:nuclear transport factor 2 family protein [Candidatus Acidoferrum sp.]
MKAKHGVLALTALALMFAGSAQAAPKTTAANMLDRLQIEDLVTDYYSQLGGEKSATFGDEYTDDGELVLGTRTVKGREEIKKMYAGIRSPNAGAPRPHMNVMVSNPRITVTGNTAHGEFIYTGVIAVAPDKAPEVHEQGREIDEFVKVKGEWKIKRRQIINDANAGFGTPPPAAKPAP